LDTAATATAPFHTPSPRRLRQARWATRAQFASLGAISGAWGVHVPSAKAHFAVDEAALAGLLLAGAIGALSALLMAGRLVARLGARDTALITIITMGASLAVLLWLPDFGAGLVAMAVFGASGSLFDMAINAEGTELESLGGRAVMSGLHGMFSLGGMAGAAITAAMLHAGMQPETQLPLLCAAVTALACIAGRGMLPTHPPAAQPQAHFVWPRGKLLLVGLLILAGMKAEGVMYDWSVLYLKQELDQPQALAALGYTTFSAAMAATRFGGDWLREHIASRRLLATGAAIAAMAMALVLLIANVWVALVGFALVGAGLALVSPILFNAATQVKGVSRAAAIAAASSIGYGGFMLGPPLIGAIAHASSLTWALGVLVLAAALLAISARYVPQADGVR
jgi:fucose permease